MLMHLSPTSVGRWSARRPWLAIAVWLAFVLATVGALGLTGLASLQNGAVGESARGYAMMDAHQLSIGPLEDANVQRVAENARDPRVRAAIEHVAGGGDSANGDLKRAEQLSVPVTLVVLVIAFGALVAACVPVLLAVTAVVAAFGLLGPISQLFALDDSVKTVVLLIGMAVGVDYALFYVVRSREERRRGLAPQDAIGRAAGTSGRAVLVAGSTVAIAMAGQFAIGSNIFNGIASGTIVVVACAVAGSLTVLPALLQLLGPRIDRGRIPGLPSLPGDGEARVWGAILRQVLRRPLISAAASGGLLIALAIPALGMHVAKPSSFALSSAGQSALAARITAEYPSLSAPAIVVATWPPSQRAAARSAVDRLERAAAGLRIAHRPFMLAVGSDGTSLALGLPLTGLGDNGASRRAVRALRHDLVPRTLGSVAGVRTAVTGDTAEDLDFTSQMTRGVPFVVGFVLTLAFVLLLVAFRSIVVPLKAIVLNLLSVGASYGVLVLVFQHRWAQGLLGFHSDGAIVSWLPLFLFVVLFGLSMDYHVFILSRVREGVDAGLPTDAALRDGITRTAGVVTSAALVMVGVFSLFGTSSSLDLKQAGVGLAVAVALDATVIRGVLLPATMQLLGEGNWYLPAKLRVDPARESRAVRRPGLGGPLTGESGPG
jgi:uncharacterized membrane protein YdfJ with MMPL/SSD domain